MPIINLVYEGYKEGWKPGANTLLYLPLESDVVDQSGKTGRTFTTSGLSYTTVGGVPSVHVGTTGGISVGPNGLVNTSITKQTISVLVYNTQNPSSYNRIIEFAIQNTNYVGLLYGNGKYRYSNAYDGWNFADIILNQRNHIVITSDGNTRKMYLNGELKQTTTDTRPARGSRANSYEQNQNLFNSRDGLSSSSGLNGNARELIFEDKIWSETDVVNYYTRIKGKLGF